MAVRKLQSPDFAGKAINMGDPSPSAGLTTPCPLCKTRDHTPRMSIKVGDKTYFVHLNCATDVVATAIYGKIVRGELPEDQS